MLVLVSPDCVDVVTQFSSMRPEWEPEESAWQTAAREHVQQPQGVEHAVPGFPHIRPALPGRTVLPTGQAPGPDLGGQV